MNREPNNKLSFGYQIEDQAADYLTKFGFILITRNYRIRGGEIDLIFEETLGSGEVELVFVEVRARCSDENWVSGVESVDWKKKRKLERTIKHFLMQYRGGANGVRLDILAWDGSVWEHVKNVWLR